jgi:hypothetical protein
MKAGMNSGGLENMTILGTDRQAYSIHTQIYRIAWSTKPGMVPIEHWCPSEQL